jgi:parvulin-like peptidyl-prolyl isomerase
VKDALAALRARALAGESFATLAAAESDDPETKPLGGAFPGGWRDARWSVEISRAVRALAVGAISEPLELTDGFALFLVEHEQRVPFESAKDELATALRERPPTAAERAGWINLGLATLTYSPGSGLYR